MENTLKTDPWLLIEEEFHPENQLNSESIFSIGNGKIGQTGNFEEFFSGKSEPKTNIPGIYINKSIENSVNRISELSNLPDWTEINVRLNAEMLDLNQCEIFHFQRSLNLKSGLLERNFEVLTNDNHHIDVSVQRFLSLAQPEVGIIKYSVKSIDFIGRISFIPVIDGNFDNNEPEWNVLQSKTQKEVAHLWIQTRKSNFQVCEAVSYDLIKNNALIKTNPTKIEKQNVAGFSVGTDLKIGDTVCIYKFVALLSSLDYPYKELTSRACDLAIVAKTKGWNELFEENCSAWEQKWENFESIESKEEIYKYFKQFQPGLQ